MATKRRQIGVKSLTALTLAQESYLKCGIYFFDWPGGPEEHFADDAEAEAAWHAHREKVLSAWDMPGERPPLLWQLDVGLKCERWPDIWAWPKPYESQSDVVRAMVAAGEIESCKRHGSNRIAGEVGEIERDWLHAIHCAISGTFKPELDPFEATAWRGVPRWYYDQHAPAVKVAVAAERAAWKRSIGRHIGTSAHCG